jgi:hypothetical protein
MICGPPICGPPRSARPTPASPITLRPPFPSIHSVLVIVLASVSPALAEWVRFEDQTATRLAAAPGLGAADAEDKTYAWGDLDRDGDDDLVVARTQPFNAPGKRVAVLLLNQAGVLVDRTIDRATSSDVAGDSGFLTPVSNRDVLIVDVDMDGWPDVVTATAGVTTDPKFIGHPRVYRNLGSSAEGWLGLRHEGARIPTLLSDSGAAGFQPRFDAVAAGDLTGDGYPELYFVDFDQGAEEPAGSDFNDKLLLNQGATNPGFFTDVTALAFAGLVPLPVAQPFPVSSWGIATAIDDMNGDGLRDIVKLTTEQPPIYLGIAYNGGGVFHDYDALGFGSPYYVDVGDLNNDGRLDLVVTDDGADRYRLNQGNGADGHAEFKSFTFAFSHEGSGGPAGDQGFGGDSRIADLDHDGWNDVLITDVSAEIPGCARRMAIYRNLGGTPGGDVQLEEQTAGSGCLPAMGNPPSCIVAGIPSSQLEGVQDVAVLDIDLDGLKDLVVGRCSGTTVYRNVPPSPAGAVPDGEGVSGTPLTVQRKPLGRVQLDWSPSCSASDTDYEVYEGVLGNFAERTPRACSTGGATSLTFAAGNAAYFLVVPRNQSREGSYGRDSTGSERIPAASACLPQALGGCE